MTHHDTTEPHVPSCVTAIADTARFALGHIVVTRPALALLQETGFSAAQLLIEHVAGRWGDVCVEDAEANEFAVHSNLRILSVYRLVSPSTLSATPESERSYLPTLWLITEADRSSTCVLTPECY